MIAPHVNEKLGGLKEGYYACLLKLSAVDPINAFRLRGREEVFTVWERLLASVTESYPGFQGMNISLASSNPWASVRHHLKDSTLVDTDKLVLEIIKDTAKRIGGSTQNRLPDLLAKKSKHGLTMEKDLNVIFDKIEQLLATHPTGV